MIKKFGTMHFIYQINRLTTTKVDWTYLNVEIYYFSLSLSFHTNNNVFLFFVHTDEK